MNKDEHYLREALHQARLAAQRGELPYGAVAVASDGSIAARAHDEVEALHDLTAHAEILAVRGAAITGRDLDGYRLYCTVEPCSMCFSAAWTARFGAVIYGVGMRELAEEFPDSMDEVVVDAASLNQLASRRLVLRGDVLRAECLAIWRELR